MFWFCQQEPVKFPGFAPLLELAEFLSHEQQLFARMSEHVAVSGFQVLKLVLSQPGHLVDHRALQMHNLIMRQYKDVLLTVGITHGERHLMVIIFAEIWVKLHIFQEIVHPPHIPFQTESQTAFLRLARHHWPCCGFLGDHDSTFVFPKDYGVQVLKKFNRFQVLVLTVFVRYPLPCLSSIIQIQHGGHCIHTKPVNVIFLYPKKRVGDQEVLHLIFAVIENFCPPVRMLPFSWICILICRGSVKISQSVGILRKMCRHPVQDHADFIFMHVIHKILEVLRGTIPGSGCIISCNLVSPGTVKGVLRNPHQFHMGISHLFHIVSQGMRQLSVIVKSILISVL